MKSEKTTAFSSGTKKKEDGVLEIEPDPEFCLEFSDGVEIPGHGNILKFQLFYKFQVDRDA